MRLLLNFLFLFTIFASAGQITAEKTSYSFGDLYPNAQTYVDIKFTNHTNKRHFLLNVDKPRDIYYLFSGKTLLPDSSIILRLKINDGKKGRFSNKVDVYFSDSSNPTTIQLSGNVKQVSRNPLTGCPDFSSSPNRGGNAYEFAVTVKVIDSLTLEPIRRSKVYFVQNNSLIGEYYTNKDGIIHREMPLGYYYMTAEKENYFSNHKEGYLNFQHNYVEIKLKQPISEVEEYAEIDDPIIVNIDPEPLIEEEIVIDLSESDPEPIEEIEEIDSVTIVEISEEPEPFIIDDTPLEDLPDSLFDDAHFKLNNITFILDVSSSMNSSGKLDLLKLSMTELAKVLRPEDAISVIKYSSSIGVVVENKTGKDQEEIIEKVNSLTTSSSTAGGDAIKAAYRMSNKAYKPGRNNIVIMVTDGAFNKGSKDYLETIAKNYNEKGIIFSVVGIKTSSYITDHMANIVHQGGGDFIEIRSIEDAQTKIIKEIKRTSFRGR